jgi:hypothetical protein
MKAYGGLKVQLHAFLTSEADGGGLWDLCPECLKFGERAAKTTEYKLRELQYFSSDFGKIKIFLCPASNPNNKVVQSLAYSHCTDWGIVAPTATHTFVASNSIEQVQVNGHWIVWNWYCI